MKIEKQSSQMVGKLELACRYFPLTEDKNVARHHLMAWIRCNTELWDKLLLLGYNKHSQYFSPNMVACIYEYLGSRDSGNQ